MSEKAKIKINKLLGSDRKGLFFNEGFSNSMENGVFSLDEAFTSSELINNSNIGYSDLANVKSALFINSLSGSNKYKIILDDNGILHSISENTGEIISGKIGGISSDTPYIYCSNPDMFELPSGNIIYTSGNHLSLVVRGKCLNGSNATKIIDSAGRNFLALGIDINNSKRNKVINLKTGHTYTVTSILTTNSSNDTLVFSQSSGLTNETDSEFLAFVYDKWDLNAGITLPSFNYQPSGTYWHRQIKEFYGEYFILNGNYLARLDNTESTLTADKKRFVSGHQALSFDVNSGKILFSTYSQSKAYLCLWDGFSNDFNNILEIDSPAFEIKSYSSGWIYLVNGILYFTNGYSTQKLGEYVGNSELENINISLTGFNQIAIIRDNFYFVSPINGTNGRNMSGVYHYNASYGWSYIPIKYKSKNYSFAQSIFVNNGYNPTFGTFSPTLEVGGASSYNVIYDKSEEIAPNSHSFICFLDLEELTQIQKVELTITRLLKRKAQSNQDETYSNITVSIGDGKNGLYSFGQVINFSTPSTLSINGTANKAGIGDELFFLDGSCRGERTFITNIENKGTVNELWTVSPALSTSYNNNNAKFKIIKVKKCGETKTIKHNDTKEPIRFDADGSFYKKIFIEVVVSGNFPISILDLNLF